MRSRDYRRHQTERHMMRRLREDWAQHHYDGKCPCFWDPKEMARFKEQPAFYCHCSMCGRHRDKKLRTRRWERHAARAEASRGDTGPGCSAAWRRKVVQDAVDS